MEANFRSRVPLVLQPRYSFLSAGRQCLCEGELHLPSMCWPHAAGKSGKRRCVCCSGGGGDDVCVGGEDG